MKDNSSSPSSQKGVWKRFFKMLLKARLPYIWIIAYIALSFGLTNIGVSTTEYTAEMFAGNVSFAGVILPFVIFTLVALLIGTLNGITYQICTAFIDRNLRRMVWKKLVHLPMKYYDGCEPSELLSRITTDTSGISALMMQVFVSCITSIYTLVILSRKIISYDTGLMLSLLVCVPFVVVIPAVLGKLNFGFSDRANRRNAELTQEISEKANNIETVKAFSSEEKETERGISKMKNLYRANIRRSWLVQLTSPLYVITGLIQTIVIVLVGRHYYMNGSIDLVEWIAFFAFSATLCANLTSFSGYWDAFKTAQGATNRVAHIMEEQEEQLDGGLEAASMDGDIVFDSVDFEYDDDIHALKKTSFSVPSGRITAIVGPSGSGKSTVVSLLERLYTPKSGKITVGGEEIQTFDLRSYRRRFTCITQNIVLISGTVKDNLLYGIKREVSDDELVSACVNSGAYDFIHAYPEGFDKKLDESGRNLSGGQRQKLALARIFLEDAPFIILDESTSAMDVKSTDKFFEALRRKKSGRTVLMVAHNRQAVRYADYVIVLEEGGVKFAGSADEAVKESAFFNTLLNGEEE